MDAELIVRLALTIPVFLFALTVHEAAHAITARWGGDMTASYLGRVTLNPIPHIDPIGTIILPFIGAMSGIPLIGWAKPVPVVEQNFRRGDGYGVIVALAGPFSNLIIALFSTDLYSVYLVTLQIFFPEQYLLRLGSFNLLDQFFLYMIIINLALMAFNLMPIPPLDGSHVLWHWFVKHRPEFHEYFFMARRFGFIILLALLWTGAIERLFVWIVFPITGLMMFLANLPLDLV
jgi:Zn-dependent protease